MYKIVMRWCLLVGLAQAKSLKMVSLFLEEEKIRCKWYILAFTY